MCVLILLKQSKVVMVFKFGIHFSSGFVPGKNNFLFCFTKLGGTDNSFSLIICQVVESSLST